MEKPFGRLVGGDQFKPKQGHWGDRESTTYLALTEANKPTRLNAVRIEDGALFWFPDDDQVEVVAGPSVPSVQEISDMEETQKLMGWSSTPTPSV